MLDPVRECVDDARNSIGTSCELPNSDRPIVDGWAVSNDFLLYFLDEVFPSQVSGR